MQHRELIHGTTRPDANVGRWHAAVRACVLPLALLALFAGATGRAAAAQEAPAVNETPDAASATAAEPARDFLASLPKGAGTDQELALPEVGAGAARVVLVMAGLIAAVIGGFLVFGRLSRRGLRTMAGSRPLRVMDRVALGPKKYACVLNACGRHLLIGIGEREITLLMELDLSSDEDTVPDFCAELTQAGRRRQGVREDAPEPAAAATTASTS